MQQVTQMTSRTGRNKYSDGLILGLYTTELHQLIAITDSMDQSPS
jgi:hypothetical protein